MGRMLVGKKLGMKVSTTTICVVSWSLNPTNDVQEVTNSCSGGRKEYEEGLDGGDGSAVLLWDVTKNPFESGYGAFKAGAKKTLTLQLEAGVTGGDFSVPIIITGTPIAITVAGRVELTINFNINGQITYPVGTIESGGSSGPLSAKGTPEEPVGFVVPDLHKPHLSDINFRTMQRAAAV